MRLVATKDIDPIESAIIGTILLMQDYSEFTRMMELGLSEDHFHSLRTKPIFMHCKKLMLASELTSAKILSFILENESLIYGAAEKSLFIHECTSIANESQFFENCSSLMEKRFRAEAENELKNVSAVSGVELLDEVEAKITKLRLQSKHKDNDEKKSACEELIEELTSDRKLKPSGVQVWDSCLGGLPEAQLIVIAGRPGGGKTSVAEQMIHEKLMMNEPILYIQRELSRSRAIGRLACRLAKVTWSRVEMRRLTGIEKDNMVRAVKEYESKPLYLSPVNLCNPSTLFPLIKRHVQDFGVSMVVMDYIQLIDVPRGTDYRIAIGEVTRCLKLVANLTGVTVLAIAQLGRNADKGARPTLSDLKESGNIEQDADAVLALWCSKERNDDARWPVNWTIMKNRNGPLGTTEVMFDGPMMKFLGETRI